MPDEIQHVVTVHRTGASCTCGEFSMTSVSQSDGIHAAYQHSRKFLGFSQVNDLREDDPDGELKKKRAKKKLPIENQKPFTLRTLG